MEYIIQIVASIIAVALIIAFGSTWIAVSSVVILTALSLIIIRRERVRRSKMEGEVERRKSALENFLTSVISNISHEFRTPLTSIIGYAQCIIQGLDGEVTQEQRRDLERVIANAEDLLRMVDDALELSKIKAGKLEPKFQPLEFKPLLKEALETIEPMARAKDLGIREDIPENLPTILGDRLKVKRILLNILSNAVKFTQEGEISIHADINDPFLEISISDTGPGIPEELQKHIFDGANRPENTGFGLNITKELVELHGGTIEVKSRPGKGTTVTFTLPIITEKLREDVLRNLEGKLDERQREIILKIYDWLKEGSWHGSSKEKGSGDR